MHFDNSIFREYDIRGVYPEQFNLDFVFALAGAFAKATRAETGENQPLITVGYDARLSSPEIAEAIHTGLKNHGCKVIDLGLIMTPLSYFSMFQFKKDGRFPEAGIMVTGSHNPPDYNGFKLSMGQKSLYGEKIQKLRSLLEFGKKPPTGSLGSLSSYDIRPQYVDHHQKRFPKMNGLTAVLDCGNGSAGCVARELYESIGIQTHILFEKPDGHFPNHHPDPTIESNLTDLKGAVKEYQASLGIGFDGDADRIGLIDDAGQFRPGDEILVALARSVLKTSPKAPIIGDVKCSDRLFDDIRRNGGKPIMWKTGHSLIKSKVFEEKAPLGGELSGHIFFLDRNDGYDDALYAGLRLLQDIFESGVSFSQNLKDYPQAFATPEIRLETNEEKKWTAVETMKKRFAQKFSSDKLNTIDGIRVSYPDGWALIRASNTQPVVVLRLEASTQKACEELRAELEGELSLLL